MAKAKKIKSGRLRIKYILNEKRVINGNIYDPGHILLEGEIPEGIEPVKVDTIIKQGKADLQIVKGKEADISEESEK